MNICPKTGKQGHKSKGAAEAHLRAMLKRDDMFQSDRELLCNTNLASQTQTMKHCTVMRESVCWPSWEAVENCICGRRPEVNSEDIRVAAGFPSPELITESES